MKINLAKKKTITALELDNDWLKLIQLNSSPKEKLISKILVEKAPSGDEDLLHRLKQLARELEINSNSLSISLPQQLVAIRNLELPSTDPAEIKSIVDLQVGKQTPYTKEEIIYDYQIIGTNAEGFSRVILAIVRADILERLLMLLEKAGLATDNVGLSSEGLLKWSEFACKKRISAKPLAMIDLDFDRSNFTVVAGGKLIFSRIISLGSLQSQINLDQWQDSLVKGINRSLHAYPREMLEEEISKVIITGADSLTGALDKAFLEEKVGLPIEIVDQFENIPVPQGALSDYKLRTKNSSVCSILGFALTYPAQKINLLPAKRRIAKGVRERAKNLYLLGIYLVAALLLISSIFLGRIYSRQRHLGRLKNEGLSSEQNVVQLDRMMQEIVLVQRRSTNQDLALNLITEVHRVISPEIYLTSISFNGEDKLTLRGVSHTMSEIFKFLNALEDSQYFQNVKTKFVTSRKVEEEDLTEFEIVCPLESK